MKEAAVSVRRVTMGMSCFDYKWDMGGGRRDTR
jgi:hypothetical protein